MNLPQLTAYIGEITSVNEDNEFGSLIKSLKINFKKEVVPYTIFLVFDLQNEEINFEVYDEFREEHFISITILVTILQLVLNTI